MMADRGYIPPSRVGLVALTIYVSPERRQALKVLAAQQGTSAQEIMEAALEKEMKKRLDKNK